DQSPGNLGNAGSDPTTFRCELDPKLTKENLPFFIPDIEGTWGAACGRNRGVFVLKPADGHTYSEYNCGKLPEAWGVSDVSAITDLNKTTPATALKAYGNLVEAIYSTTVGKTAEACDFNALTVLTCGREEPWRTAPWYDRIKAPIRGINIGGLFVLERWILPAFTKWGDETGITDQHSFSAKCGDLGTCDKLKDHWKNWYDANDFKEMQRAGLNTVRLPVGWWYFAPKFAVSPQPYILPDEDLYDRHHPITDVIGWAKDAGLQVILDLHGAPGSQNGLDNSGLTSPNPNNLVWGESWMYSPVNYGNTVRTLATMAEYINHIEDAFELDNIMALELLNEPWAFLDLGRVRDFYVTSIEAVRLVRPLMPIILHDAFRGPMWATLLKDFPFKDVVMDTHIYHGFNAADASSDTAVGDRQKMYVHERMACSYTSMLRYQTCAVLPVFVGEWSLAVDNCMPWLDSKFENYGQCDNLKERESKSWWTEHTRSFAMKQLNTYERELGWAFWTWKLEDQLEKNEGAAKYWSFRLALDYGFIDTDFPDNFCIHPPTANWMDLNVSNEMPSEVQLINLTETFDKCWGSSPCSTATSTASMTRAGEKSNKAAILTTTAVAATFGFIVGATVVVVIIIRANRRAGDGDCWMRAAVVANQGWITTSLR
ncbi:unnamed protein product, partial [Ascophyllum nodosum]